MRPIANLGLPVLPLIQSAFTTAVTFARTRLLGVAAILTTGRRTVTNLLRTVAGLAEPGTGIGRGRAWSRCAGCTAMTC